MYQCSHQAKNCTNSPLKDNALNPDEITFDEFQLKRPQHVNMQSPIINLDNKNNNDQNDIFDQQDTNNKTINIKPINIQSVYENSILQTEQQISYKRGQLQYSTLSSSRLIKKEQLSFLQQYSQSQQLQMLKQQNSILFQINKDILEDIYYTYLLNENSQDLKQSPQQTQNQNQQTFYQSQQQQILTQTQQNLAFNTKNIISNQQLQDNFDDNNNNNQYQALQLYIYNKQTEQSYILKKIKDTSDYEYEKYITDQITQTVIPKVAVPIIEKDEQNNIILYNLSTTYNCSLQQFLNNENLNKIVFNDDNIMAIFCGLIQICITLSKFQIYFSSWLPENILLLLDYSQYKEDNTLSNNQNSAFTKSQLPALKNCMPINLGLINFDCTSIKYSNLIIQHESQKFYLPQKFLNNFLQIGENENYLDESQRIAIEFFQIGRIILEIIIKMKVSEVDQQQIYLQQQNLKQCISFLQTMNSGTQSEKLVNLLLLVLQEDYESQEIQKIINIFEQSSVGYVNTNTNYANYANNRSANNRLSIAKIQNCLGISVNLTYSLAQQIKIIHQTYVLQEWCNNNNNLETFNQGNYAIQLENQIDIYNKFNMLGQSFKTIIKLNQQYKINQNMEKKIDIIYKGIQLIYQMSYNLQIWQQQIELGIKWLESFDLQEISVYINNSQILKKVDFFYKAAQIYYIFSKMDLCFKYLDLAQSETEKYITNNTSMEEQKADQINIFKYTPNYQNNNNSDSFNNSINNFNFNDSLMNSTRGVAKNLVATNNNNKSNTNTNNQQILVNNSNNEYELTQMYFMMMQILGSKGKIYYDQGNIKQALELYQQALNSSSKCKSEADRSFMLIEIHHKIGTYYYDQSNPEKAEKHLIQALSIGRKLFEVQSIQVMHMLNNLGSTHYQLGKLKEAEKEFKEAYEIAKANYGQNNLTVAMIIINLSILHSDIDQYQLALQENENAMEIVQQTNQQENSLAVSLTNKVQSPRIESNFQNNLGFSQQKPLLGLSQQNQQNIGILSANNNDLFNFNFKQSQLNGYQQAQNLIFCNQNNSQLINLTNKVNQSQKSINNNSFYKKQDQFDLQPQIKMYQIDNQLSKLQQQISIYSLCLGNQSDILRKMGQLQDSELYCIKAMDLLRKVNGDEHFSVGNKYNSLGLIYKDQGKYPQSEQCFQNALVIIKKCYGENHLNVANILCNLGNVYQIQRKLPEAEQYYSQGLQLKEKFLGSDHSSLAVEIGNLGSIYKEQKLLDKAEQMYQRALEIKKKHLGEDHQSLAIEINNLGNIYMEQKKFNEAEVAFNESLRLKEKAFGPSHHSLVVQYSNLGNLYMQQQRLAEAENLYKKSLQIKKSVQGENHPSLAVEIGNLGALYQKQGNLQKAEEYYLQAIDLKEKGFGINSTQLILSLGNLSCILKNQNRTSEAIKVIKRIISIVQQNYGEDHQDKIFWQQQLDQLVSQEKLLDQ